METPKLTVWRPPDLQNQATVRTKNLKHGATKRGHKGSDFRTNYRKLHQAIVITGKKKKGKMRRRPSSEMKHGVIKSRLE